MNDEQAGPIDGPIDGPTEEDRSGLDEDLLVRAREAAAGHPGLEEALHRLEALDDVDLDRHPEEFDAIHRALRSALSDAGQDPQGQPGS